MNIAWVIPCRYVEINNSLGTIIGAGIDIFWVPRLPAAIRGMLALRVTGTADDFGEEVTHELASRILGPTGDPLGKEIKGEFQAGAEHVQEDWLNAVWIPSGFQFTAPGAGTYTLEISVDKATASLPLHVIHGPPGSRPADAS